MLDLFKEFTTVDLVVLILLAAIAAGILLYLRRAKKSGATCIGCPHAKQCGGNCSCGGTHSAVQAQPDPPSDTKGSAWKISL